MSKPVLSASDYDRSACQIGVVHLGYGAFHRAHQAVYLDDYLQHTGDLRWAIAAVNLRSGEADSFARAQAASDGYILRAVAPDGTRKYRKVRPHVRFADWTRDADGALDLVALDSVHMITITVTESGYYLDDAGALNPEHPQIKAEIDGTAQTTVFAFLAAGLARRMAAGGQPVTILCCDNIRHNGKMLRASLLTYLKLCGFTDLAAWVTQNATFPCSMVDRITPRATSGFIAEIQADFGADQTAPVLAEDFIQWVIEDDFAGPMPDLAQVGVTVTKDVDPYEEAKIRILNGGHTCLTYLGALAGHQTFDQAMADPALFDHFWAYETTEVLPALTLDLPFDKAEYLAGIAARFRNRSIADTIERIAADGFAKFPIFIQPTLAGCLLAGHMPVYGLRSAASWYVFARGVAQGTLALKYAEPNWSALAPLLAPGRIDDFTHSAMLWAELPERYQDFAPALRHEIEEMETKWLK